MDAITSELLADRISSTFEANKIKQSTRAHQANNIRRDKLKVPLRAGETRCRQALASHRESILFEFFEADEPRKDAIKLSSRDSSFFSPLFLTP